MTLQARACTDLAESLWKFERNWPPISSQGVALPGGVLCWSSYGLIGGSVSLLGEGFEVSNALISPSITFHFLPSDQDVASTVSACVPPCSLP